MDVAHGLLKITGSVEFANINIPLFNNLLFAGTYTTGSEQFVNYEAVTVPAGATAAAQKSPFINDFGVWYANAAGLSGHAVDLHRATAPSTGTYAVNSSTGVYTFAAGDMGNSLLLSYSYSATGAANGNTLSYSNQLMGRSP